MDRIKFSNLSKAMVFSFVLILINLTMFKAIFSFGDYGINTQMVMGGLLNSENYESFKTYVKDFNKPDDQYIERFLRPSNVKAIDKKYIFDGKQEIPKVFSMPSEVVRAYFDVLSDASNMGNKKGGCGSIGVGNTPYPAAYELLSDSLKKSMSYDKFLKSFEGIGHINLLKFVEISAVKADNRIVPRFFVEIETIEGSDVNGKTYFGYYYGFVTVEQEGEKGWKLNKIELKPEDFLCHAYHGWWHEASAIVEIVYGKQCGIIDKILGTEEDGDFRNVIAKGKDGKQYRFMFIRLTNGADIELRQFVMEKGKWTDIYIDPEKFRKND